MTLQYFHTKMTRNVVKLHHLNSYFGISLCLLMTYKQSKGMCNTVHKPLEAKTLWVGSEILGVEHQEDFLSEVKITTKKVKDKIKKSRKGVH